MKKIINHLLAAALCSTGALTARAQGLENIIVEQYHTITTADADAYNNVFGGGSYPMVAGMKSYRVYVDMAPNYKLNLVFGSPAPVGGGVSPNPLDITTTTTFWNDDNFGTEIPGQTRRLDEGTAFDSYITINTSGTAGGTVGCGSNTQQFGVLKTADTNGNLTFCSVFPSFPAGAGTPDGNLPGTGSALTYNIGGLMNFAALQAAGSTFQVVDDSWTTLPASTGVDPTGTNHVLIGQFTTSGTFSFHLNVQLSSPSSQLETYVWNQAGSGEVVSPLLTYPVACTPVDITGIVSNSPSCSTSSLTLNATVTGTAPITYSWVGTGTFNPNATSEDVSVSGAATGTYTLTATNACGTDNMGASVTVTPAPAATISYTGSPYCSNAGTMAVTQTGTAGGTYSSTAGLSINSGTGAVNTGASTAGTYTVTYTIAAGGGCAQVQATTSITITTLPAATISYTGSPYCSNAGTVAVSQTGTAGGTYSSTAGLSINSGSGAVNTGTSTAGTYTVTYTIAAGGGCAQVQATASITITALPTASFSYAGSPYCIAAGGTASPTFAGTAGGTYSSTAGLSLNSGSGVVTIGTSTPGTYTVTYTIAAAGGCAQVQATASITIQPDTDGDGVCDPNDNCPTVFGQQGSSCNDGNALTINDVLNASCVCVGTPVACVVNGDCNDSNPCTSDACVSNSCVYTPLPDTDGDGICNAQDNCPNLFGQQGDACNDGNALTIGDVINASCVCVGTPVTCVVNGDCNDSNPCTSDACVSNVCVYTPLPDSDGDGICNAQDNCPNLFGQQGDACNDGNATTINDVINTSCVCVGTPTTCTEVLNFSIKLDNFGSENTAELRDVTGTIIVAQAGPFANGVGGTTVTSQFCVPVGCYHLYVYDSGSNGIAGGGYTLKNAAGKRIIDANGLFGGISNVVPEFCLPLSNQGMISASCDRTNLAPNTMVYCTTQAGASGYQFWWFDPHGSYSRRILVSSPSMKPNQVVTNPIPLNLDLNVRVRALISGSYTAFGAACRARVNGSGGSAIVDGASYHSQLLGDQASLALTLYPNPNRDGQVNLVVVGMGDATEQITLDVYDLFGKRVHTEQVEASGEEFTHTMNLDLATGMYMVNLTIDGRVITQRLIKQ